MYGGNIIVQHHSALTGRENGSGEITLVHACALPWNRSHSVQLDLARKVSDEPPFSISSLTFCSRSRSRSRSTANKQANKSKLGLI